MIVKILIQCLQLQLLPMYNSLPITVSRSKSHYSPRNICVDTVFLLLWSKLAAYLDQDTPNWAVNQRKWGGLEHPPNARVTRGRFETEELGGQLTFAHISVDC